MSTEGTYRDKYRDEYRDEYGEDFGDDCEDDAYLKNPLTTYRPPSQYAALRTQDNSVGRARDVAAVAVVLAVLA